MDTVVWQIGYGALGGLLSYLVFQGILSIKCLRLQGQLNALQNIVLSLRNTGYVSKRWQRADELEGEVLSTLTRTQSRAQRYDNDPLSIDPQAR